MAHNGDLWGASCDLWGAACDLWVAMQDLWGTIGDLWGTMLDLRGPVWIYAPLYGSMGQTRGSMGHNVGSMGRADLDVGGVLQHGLAGRKLRLRHREVAVGRRRRHGGHLALIVQLQRGTAPTSGQNHAHFRSKPRPLPVKTTPTSCPAPTHPCSKPRPFGNGNQ